MRAHERMHIHTRTHRHYHMILKLSLKDDRIEVKLTSPFAMYQKCHGTKILSTHKINPLLYRGGRINPISRVLWFISETPVGTLQSIATISQCGRHGKTHILDKKATRLTINFRLVFLTAARMQLACDAPHPISL